MSDQPDLVDAKHASGAECYSKALELVGDARRLRRNLVDLDSDQQRDEAELRAATIELVERRDPATGTEWSYEDWDAATRRSEWGGSA